MTKVRKTIKKLMITIAILYLFILISTAGVIGDFIDCAVGRTEGIDRRNKLLGYSVPEGIAYDYVDVIVIPIFAAYGFEEGIVIVRYTTVAYKNGVPVSGSWHITSKWKVKRIDGEWIVVEIDEHP